ncbi:tetratricopeptide repeat protein [Massilia aerilata]|uniref:Tetratricopeptide repeat protein n=1 Tax=Massilia aerilata TaxID=453817 RepID=A0ABW0RRN9_9BURK
MSLINKMLQDLDARGTPGAEAFPSQIRPVAPARERLADRFERRTVVLAAGGAFTVCAAAALAWYGWGHHQQGRGAARPAAMAAPAAVRAPAAAPAPVAEAPAPVREQAGDSFDAPPLTEAPVRALPKVRQAEMEGLAGKGTAQPAAPKRVAGYAPDSEQARAARQATMAELQSRMKVPNLRPAAAAHPAKAAKETKESKRQAKRRKLAEERELKAARRANAVAEARADAAAAKGKRSAGTGASGAQGRQESGAQRAEGEYRHALNALQDGRMTEAMAALEHALKLDPAHEAARQTLVGLLIEAKRSDEAIRHLQTALALDARQPALAMLLARLQIERGASGVDTLTRTLPYAGTNADYRAFLAGALQREQRHREAAEQYQAALRSSPGNGVWWMGLGMSLQAEKRNAEALEAFQRARASGSLSAELTAFVERRLQQLAR